MTILKHTTHRAHIIILFWVAILTCTSCEDYLEAEDPVGQIPKTTVFEDENTATAAVTSLYARLRDDALLTGNSDGVGVLMGWYADELDFYGEPLGTADSFYTHQVLPSNVLVEGLWDNSYHVIFMTNAALEGLENSQTLPEALQEQLRGEGLFLRAMVHFYLAELFGDIPYLRTTDYLANTQVQRLPVGAVYTQIIEDLAAAKQLLPSAYPTGERVRATKSVASALLARVYLYAGQWAQAEAESTLVLNDPNYALETDLNAAFLRESQEAILQSKPKNEGDNTLEGTSYLFQEGPPPLAALTENLVGDMEAGDLRKQFWVTTITDGNTLWYAPYKYKQNLNTGTSLEYSIVLRLAEQYLIRSEARTRQGNLSGGIADLNVVRQRAGLESLPAMDAQETLARVLRERRFELFTEFGHRWFDLKRFGRADAVLSPLKPGWKDTDILLPLPESELLLNPNLEPQNPGY